MRLHFAELILVAATFTALHVDPCPPGSINEPEPCGSDLNPGCDGTPPDASNCCYAHSGVGCDEPNCMGYICSIDQPCCSVQWDGICAAEAFRVCGNLCNGVGGGPQAWTPIVSGQPICGTLRTGNGSDAVDWYEFATTADTTRVTLTVSSPSAIQFGIADTDGQPICALANTLDPVATSAPGALGILTTCLPSGVHWIVVNLVATSGVPCGSPAGAYVLTMTIDDQMCELPDPINDACSSAIEILEGSTFVATVSAGAEIGPFEEDCAGFGKINGDVWFKYVATRTGVLRIATCGTCTFDARLLAYSGSCAAPQLIACDDNGFGCAFSDPGLDLDVVEGEAYLLRFGGLDVTDGEATMTLSYVPCAPAYLMEVICFDDSYSSVTGKGISEDGEVVGERAGPVAFRWTPETGYKDVPGAGSTYGSLVDVNSAGVAVGWIKSGAWPRPAYAPADILVPLPLPTGCTKGEARGINEFGVMIGDVYGLGCDEGPLAWINGELFGLPIPAQALHGFDVNDQGTMLGDGQGPIIGALQPWLLQGTNFSWLLPVYLFYDMKPLKLGSQNQVVGHSLLDDTLYPQTMGFVWDGRSYAIFPPPAGFVSSSVKDISDDGTLLIEYDTGSPSAEYAPFVRRGGVPIALTSLVGPETGWELVHVAAINGAGQIVGTARKGSHKCAVRLTPLPPTADLDCDGVVNATDLATLLGSWGPCAENASCAADFTLDGMVDAADLSVLLGAWGE